VDDVGVAGPADLACVAGHGEPVCLFDEAEVLLGQIAAGSFQQLLEAGLFIYLRDGHRDSTLT
jgi:hypothetical protein